MEVYATLKTAFQLRKEKKYSEALAIYEPLYTAAQEGFGEWEAWSFVYCYRGVKQYERFLDACRLFYKKFPGSALIKEQYAWAIYYTEMAGNDLQSGYTTQKKALEAILSLSAPGTPYGCAERAVFRLVKNLSLAMQPDWLEIDRLLSFLDPLKLDDKTYSFERAGGKKTELASDLEEWYSWKSKALLQTGDWQGCIDVCMAALANITRWHYSNNIWFERRRAAALAKMGRQQEAKAIVADLVAQKKEWFLLYDLAELETGEDARLGLRIEAALLPGEADKKLRLYMQLAHYYQKNNIGDMALQLALACLSIRLHNHWPVSHELEQMIKTLGSYPAEVKKPFDYLGPLISKWKLQAEKGRPVFSGKIISILPQGKSGFISVANTGKNVYFTTKDWVGKPPPLRVGLEVKFSIEKSWDRVKRRESEKAVYLEPEKKERNE